MAVEKKQTEETIVVWWVFKDKYNKWRHCDDELTSKLEGLSPNQSIILKINGKSYRMNKTDKNNASQTNISTKTVRSMKRIENKFNKMDEVIFWQWMDNDNKWRIFDEWISNEIESMSLNSMIDIIINGRKYKIFKQNGIDDAYQYNVKTKKQRSIKRVVKYSKNGTIWQYQTNDNKTWIDLPLIICIDIENLGIGESFNYILDKHKSYIIIKISQSQCEQIRRSTKKKRILRRIANNIHKYMTPIVDDNNDNNNDIEMDKDEIHNDNECVICMDNDKNYCCTPCGHLCLCQNCTKIINGKCPICRAECTVIKIFK